MAARRVTKVRVIKDGLLLPTAFLSLGVSSIGERGLLGIAFDPDFLTNHYVYVYYTVTTFPIHNRVSRFTANGDVAMPGSEQIILDLLVQHDEGQHDDSLQRRVDQRKKYGERWPDDTQAMLKRSLLPTTLRLTPI